MKISQKIAFLSVLAVVGVLYAPMVHGAAAGELLKPVDFLEKGAARPELLFEPQKISRSILREIKEEFLNKDIYKSDQAIFIMQKDDTTQYTDQIMGNWSTNNFPAELHRSYYHFGIQGRRPEMEDAHCEAFFEVNGKKYAFFGVFDGHGGSTAAQFCAQLMPKIVKEKLNDGLSVKEVLKQSCITINTMYLQDTLLSDGTTAIVALVNYTDSTGCLCGVGDACGFFISGNQIVSYTTEDNLDDDEVRARLDGLEAQYNKQFYDRSYNRLLNLDDKPGMNVFRTIGDRAYKNPNRPDTAPAEPRDKNLIEFSYRGQSNPYIVLTCDGVWERGVTNNDVLSIISAGTDEYDMAKALVDKAYKAFSGDNISVTIVKLDELQRAFDVLAQQQGGAAAGEVDDPGVRAVLKDYDGFEENRLGLIQSALGNFESGIEGFKDYLNRGKSQSWDLYIGRINKNNKGFKSPGEIEKILKDYIKQKQMLMSGTGGAPQGGGAASAGSGKRMAAEENYAETEFRAYQGDLSSFLLQKRADFDLGSELDTSNDQLYAILGTTPEKLLAIEAEKLTQKAKGKQPVGAASQDVSDILIYFVRYPLKNTLLDFLRDQSRQKSNASFWSPEIANKSLDDLLSGLGALRFKSELLDLEQKRKNQFLFKALRQPVAVDSLVEVLKILNEKLQNYRAIMPQSTQEVITQLGGYIKTDIGALNAAFNWVLQSAEKQPGTIVVRVYLPQGGDIAYVHVRGDGNVGDLKEAIAAQIHRPVQDQKLFLRGNQLDNKKTLKELNIVDGTYLNLALVGEASAQPAAVPIGEGQMISVFMQPISDVAKEMRISDASTVAQLKQQLMHVEGMKADQFDIIFTSQSFLNENKTLSSLGIINGSVISYSVRTKGGISSQPVKSVAPSIMTVKVQFDQNTREYEIKNDAMVAQLKGMVRYRYYDNISGEQVINFTLQGRELEDDTPLAACGIPEGSIINVSLKQSGESVSIQLVATQGQYANISVKINSNSKIAELKGMISEHFKLKLNIGFRKNKNQRLDFKDTQTISEIESSLRNAEGKNVVEWFAISMY